MRIHVFLEETALKETSTKMAKILRNSSTMSENSSTVFST